MTTTTFNGMLHGARKCIASKMPGRVLFLSLCFVTGLLAGIAAFMLKFMIGSVSEWFTRHFSPHHANWAFVVLPVVGVVLAALFQRYVARRDIYHGVDRLDGDLRSGRYKLPVSLTVTPMIASALTLGFGGSAGSEGPIAYTGAAIGSNVGKGWGLTPMQMKAIVACGAAAGIAGIFKAPIGGAFFALECLPLQMASTVAIIGLMIASVTAGLMAFVLSGCTPDIYFSDAIPLDIHWLPWVVGLGVFAGIYSIYYQLVMTRLSAWYAHQHNRWMKNLIAGGIIGCAILVFPPLYGEGYGFISHLLADDIAALTPYGFFASEPLRTPILLILLGGMMLVKAFATASTTSGGGVAGDFAPSLFAGCVAGYFFAMVANLLTDGCSFQLPPGYFAFFGMGAVMAATQRAPLMAIFLTVEMGSAYTLLLPVVVVATISYFTFSLLSPHLGLHNPAPRN